MEKTITTLIYLHAFFGGIGLITGIISFLSKKGEKQHRKLGKLFSYSMVISSVISLAIARMPKHENLFLFLIGIFTIYLVLAGNRALTLKLKSKSDWIDKSVSGTMLIASFIMITIGIIGQIQHIQNSILFLFFGSFGLFMSLKDFKTFRTFQENKNAWLISHIGRMIGALIASITAFLVVGLHIGSVFIWISPTIIGTIYIIVWNRRIKKQNLF